MFNEDDLLTEEVVPPYLVDTVIGLAHEGVPIRAIARATKCPSPGIYYTIQAAIGNGRLVDKPRDDWSVGKLRDAREPSFVTSTRVDDENLIYSCVRLFKLTRLQASLFAVIVMRNEVSKETLHQIIESRRPANKDETDPKMVDVVICNLRKKLKPYELTIKTLWACGYFMDPVERKKVLNMIGKYLNGGENDGKQEDGEAATGPLSSADGDTGGEAEAANKGH